MRFQTCVFSECVCFSMLLCMCVHACACVRMCVLVLSLALPGLEDECVRFFSFKPVLTDLWTSTCSESTRLVLTFRGEVSSPQDGSEVNFSLFFLLVLLLRWWCDCFLCHN